ncbi:DNA-binding transcriptional LysR family regulator [Bradyrhizobium sp. i1.3.1]
MPGVRYGEHLAQDMVAIPLSGPQTYVVVASPAYIARRGTPKHPKDLLDHDCIRARYSSGVMHDLEFEKAGQIVKVDPPAKLISTNMGLAMRAALDGAGIWATLDGYVHDAVRSGALVSLMEDWCEPFPGPFLYYPSRRQTPPALRAFIDFVADWRKRETRGK